MAKKSKKQSMEFPSEVSEYAHRIWLAGLGAMSMAEEEGNKVFKDLVQRGEKLENKSKDQVEKMRGKLDETRERAEGMWGSIGETFDDKVTGVLHRMGVPSRDEIAMLTKRVEELTTAVEKMQSGTAKKTTSSSSSSTTRKPAARRTTKKSTTSTSTKSEPKAEAKSE
jgi:poly(hydroxyalkanoate) granule-associated protein